VSVLFGAPRERRQWGTIPPIPPNSQTGAGGSFAQVDLTKAESSLQKVAVWSCVNLVRTIAEILPLDVYTGVGSERRPLSVPSWMQDLGGDGYGLPDWCSQVVYSAMLRGNAVGLVADRQPASGRPMQIVLQHPDAVTTRRDSGSGSVEWQVSGTRIEKSRIWHQRTNSVPGQVLGLSPIAVHALTIGTGISAMRFGSQWFGDGAHPSGLLVSEQPLGETAAKTAKQRFMDALRGTREPVVLGQGWKYQQIQIAPNESQFLETNGYTGAECCRIFGPGAGRRCSATTPVAR
jgi:HK97 family phage portal protein